MTISFIINNQFSVFIHFYEMFAAIDNYCEKWANRKCWSFPWNPEIILSRTVNVRRNGKIKHTCRDKQSKFPLNLSQRRWMPSHCYSIPSDSIHFQREQTDDTNRIDSFENVHCSSVTRRIHIFFTSHLDAIQCQDFDRKHTDFSINVQRNHLLSAINHIVRLN